AKTRKEKNGKLLPSLPPVFFARLCPFAPLRQNSSQSTQVQSFEYHVTPAKTGISFSRVSSLRLRPRIMEGTPVVEDGGR
ncbi:MAG: hypothetical protein K8T91_10100, partial [Planctomycetes bacterium]|nr:hypothetical protein [Planctomycetota bacterium]